MGVDTLNFVAYLFILAIVFDISFNLRRLVRGLDRLWRKMAEINDTLQQKGT
jgi:hypothetical protein